jgi:hypothetical protein
MLYSNLFKGYDMKSESDVRNKLKEVKYRYLKKNIKQKRKHIPQNCSFNAELVSSKDEASAISICTRESDDEWVKFYGKNDNKICDLNYDGKERCVKCPFFSWDSEKDDIKQDFDKELLDLSAAQLAFKYPEIMALSWVLDNSPDIDPLVIKEPEVFPVVEKLEDTKVKGYVSYDDFLKNAPEEEKLKHFIEYMEYCKTHNKFLYLFNKTQLFLSNHHIAIFVGLLILFVINLLLYAFDIYIFNA